MHRKTIKYKLRSKQIKFQSKFILIHVQYALKANILMSRKQFGISQEEFPDMYISSFSLERKRLDHWKVSFR